MMRKQRNLSIIGAALTVFMLSACSPDQRAAATPTKTPAPLVAVQPTDTVQLAAPLVGETAVPVVQPTSVPIKVGPDSFPADTNPLTGLPVADPAILTRRPVVVSVSNSGPAEVRPQAGLGSADHMWEHFTEGHLTRYAAVFFSDAPDVVGSVRSCRLIMFEISLMYDALWTCSGYSDGIGDRIKLTPNYYLLLDANRYGLPFMRRVNDPNVAVVTQAPHNLFAVPEEMWVWAEEREYERRSGLTGMAFDSDPRAGGTP